MTSLKGRLNQIWSTFQRDGVQEDPRIIAGVAALLVGRTDEANTITRLVPRFPDELSQRDWQQLTAHLTNTERELNLSPAEIFDRHILFRLRQMLPGSRYPTPRHLIGLMYRLAEVAPEMALADFACGSAGFLAQHMRQQGAAGRCIGIEVNSDWAGLAAANLFLHQQQRPDEAPWPELYRQDALDQDILPVTPNSMDRVLMNPPFEEPAQTKLLKLALSSLNEQGKACVLVPAGTLFNTAGDTVEVRRWMVGASDEQGHVPDFHLQAVIELPKDACQPFSGIKSFLLLIQRGSVDQGMTWFLRAKSDGYSGAKKRDLTRPPVEPNDLSIIEQLIIESQQQEEPKSEAPLAILPVMTSDGIHAFRIRVQEAAVALIEARRYTQKKDPVGHYIRLEMRRAGAEGQVIQWLHLTHDALTVVDAVKEADVDLTQTYLSNDDPSIRSLALHREGRLLGVGVDSERLRTGPYDLQVDRFVRDREEVVTGDPVDIVQVLHRQEQQLLSTIDEIRELLADQRGRPEHYPPPLGNLTELEPFGRLSDQQQKLWEHVLRILSQPEGILANGYFNHRDLLSSKSDVQEPLVIATLGLFERMGLIVPLTLRTQRGQKLSGYRLISEYDRWELPPQDEEEQNEVSTSERTQGGPQGATRLIDLSIGEYNVLKDLTIGFSASNIKYRRGYEIDFLVGLNGSGKSTLLRVLAEILLRLEGTSGNKNTIPFGFTLSYQTLLDGKEQTIRISNQRDPEVEEPGIADELRVTINGKHHDYDNRFLPQSVVILTSGLEQEWQHVEQVLQQREPPPPLTTRLKEIDLIVAEQPGTPREPLDEEEVQEVNSEHVTFIRSHQLPLVMLCGLLDYERLRPDQRENEEGFGRVLSESGIEGMAGFSLRFRPEDPFELDTTIERLYRECAPSRTVQLGSERLLIFDMSQDRRGNADNIISAFNNSYSLFKTLSDLCRSENAQDNVLQEVNIFIERRIAMRAAGQTPDDEERETDDVPPLHLFSWMSDGEQSFLSRMALLSLMRTYGALIMLDEPEVHFNDYWKRHIVNLIHQTLRNTGSHVLITTHSSITLTDVPSEDIVKIVRQGTHTTGRPVNIPIRTLAADPSDIMVHVFETGYATGERAVREILARIQPGKVLTDDDRDELKKLQTDVAPGYWSYLIRRAINDVGRVSTG